MPEGQKPYISLTEASKLTGYSTEYIRQLCVKGKINGQKLGNSWYITHEAALQIDPSLKFEKLPKLPSPHPVFDQTVANISQKSTGHPELDAGSSPPALDSGSLSGMTNISRKKSFLAVPLRQIALIIGLIVVLSIPVGATLFSLQDQIIQLQTQYAGITIQSPVGSAQPDEGYFVNLIKTTVNGILDNLKNKGAVLLPGPTNAAQQTKSTSADKILPEPAGVVLGLSTDDQLIASIKSVLADPSVQDQIRGPQGPIGPTSQYIPNSGSVFGVTAPAAEHPGTIGSSTYSSSDSFATRLLTVSSDINQTGGTASLQNTTITNLTVSGSASFSGGLNSTLLPSTDNTYDIGSTDLRFKSLRIGTGDSSFEGNVGIGTTTPDDVLKIVGAGGGGVSINQTSGSAQVTLISSGGTGIIAERTDNLLVFRNAPSGSPHVTIDSSGNVGIGMTNPGAILDVAGTIRSYAASPILLAESSTTNQGYLRLVASAGTNYIQSGLTATLGSTADLIFTDVYNNRQYLVFKGTTGNVGIGTITPTSKLQVVGSTLNANSGFLQTTSDFNNGTNVGSALSFIFGADTGNTYSSIRALHGGLSAWDNLVLQAGGGNVGIGTTNPASKMTVVGDIRIASGSGGQIIFADGSTMASSGLGSAAALSNITDAIVTGDSDANGSGDVIFKTGSNDRLHILNNGNVGIGTTNPIDTLHILNSTTTTRLIMEGYGGGGGQVIGRQAQGTLASPTATLADFSLLFLGGRGYTGGGFSASSNAGIGLVASENFTPTANGTYLSFTTTANGTTSRTEKMRIDNAGNVGIGTTNPSVKLQVSTTSKSSFLIDPSRTDRPYMEFDNSSGSAIGWIDARGNLSPAQYEFGSSAYTYITGTKSNDYGVVLLNAYGSSSRQQGTVVDTSFASTNTGDHVFGVREAGGTEMFVVNHGGNVGIGTTTPGSVLQVAGGTPTNTSLTTRASGLYVSDISGSSLAATSPNTINHASVIGATVNAGSAAYTYGALGGLDTNWFGVAGYTQDQVAVYGKVLNGGSGYAGIFTGGNVGIGTTGPGSKLEVVGNVTLNGTTTAQNTLKLSTAATSYTTLLHDTDTTDSTFLTNHSNAGGIIFRTTTSDTARMTILNGGNVGIGTSSPNGKLEIQNPVASSVLGDNYWLRFSGGGGSANQYQQIGMGYVATTQKSPVIFGARTVDPNTYTTASFFVATRNVNTDTAPTERFVVDPAGNVGIGTTGPSYKLHLYDPSAAEVRLGIVGGAVNSSEFTMYQNAGDGVTSYIGLQGTSNYLISGTGGLDNALVMYNNSGPIQFATTGANAAMTILPTSGNVGIGTTNPGLKLQVNGGIGGAAVNLPSNGSSADVTGGNLFFTNSSSPTTISSITGVTGQMIVIDCKDTNTTINRSPTYLLNSSNFTCGSAANSTLTLMAVSSGLWAEVSRSTPNGDLAEEFPTKDGTINAGEVVALDPNNSVFVKRASYGDVVLGIMSKSAQYEMAGYNFQNYANERQIAVALAGRLPIKVSEENGQIHSGDRLTISKILPGFAAKMIESGQSVGIALEDSNGGTEGTDTLLVFMNLGYQHIDVVQNSEGQLVTLVGDLNASGFALNNVKAITSLSGKWSINDNGDITANSITTQKFCIGTTCVDEAVFKSLLEKNGLLNNNQQASPQTPEASQPDPAPVVEPPADITPVVEPLVDTPTPFPAAEPVPNVPPDASIDPVTPVTL